MKVTGIERHAVLNRPEHPGPGEQVGIMLSDVTPGEIRKRQAQGEVLFLIRGRRTAPPSN